jgi:hypothetical protein
MLHHGFTRGLSRTSGRSSSDLSNCNVMTTCERRWGNVGSVPQRPALFAVYHVGTTNFGQSSIHYLASPRIHDSIRFKVSSTFSTARTIQPHGVTRESRDLEIPRVICGPTTATGLSRHGGVRYEDRVCAGNSSRTGLARLIGSLDD